ncbi:MAG: hypothetical protein AAF385_11435 [Pseudomonadota bacterium]
MKPLLGILILTMLSASANGQISYDYFEAGLEKTTFEPFRLTNANTNLIFESLDGDGPVFEGSFSFSDNYFAYADFDFTSMDLGRDFLSSLEDVFPGIDLGSSPAIDLSTQALGIGYHTDGNTQFVAKAAFLRRSIDSDFWKVSTLGYVVELGGRGLLSDNIEWEANVDYTDYDAGDSGAEPSGESFGVNAALRYHFGNHFSTDLSASTTKDEVTYGLNFRFNFSRE